MGRRQFQYPEAQEFARAILAMGGSGAAQWTIPA